MTDHVLPQERYLRCQRYIQRVPGALSLGVKLTTHLHPVPSRMRRAISPLPQYVFTAWCLVKHRDNFTFTFYRTYLTCEIINITRVVVIIPKYFSWRNVMSCHVMSYYFLFSYRFQQKVVWSFGTLYSLRATTPSSFHTWFSSPLSALNIPRHNQDSSLFVELRSFLVTEDESTLSRCWWLWNIHFSFFTPTLLLLFSAYSLSSSSSSRMHPKCEFREKQLWYQPSLYHPATGIMWCDVAVCGI
jgi:hypothetical protein